ncbi:hypothetical protein KP509_03G077400 [Ceratopteris richardii]|uniref:Hpc2-related domain-containing protein n=1 Tax=Ceratopteris richardii TaxID=49495 RepID=A0A8T2VCS0_CERRI|nr:hypothetical protein KP509_03G077400 [Ceratopteris richardii]KAH7442219.1 hypothetical protein KP509_03G077400 [Ceratopteris richardii]
MATAIQANAMLESSSRGIVAPPFAQASASASIAMPSRDRFYVELKPGETTFVSWKKLVKESQKTVGSLLPSSDAPVGAHPALEARIAPEVMKEKDPLPPPSNRFNSVIEKIERLYQGGTSDEELCEFMDEDKYDTRDSFIDDTELDDYFSVENARLKHSGFFINKGKLEREVESTPQTVGPKKRKRKDLKKLSSTTKGEEIIKEVKSAVRLKAAARRGPSPTSGSGTLLKEDLPAEKKKKGFRSGGWEMDKSIAMEVVEKDLNAAITSMQVPTDITGNKGEVKQSLEGVVADGVTVESLAGSSGVKDSAIGLIDINEPFIKDVMPFESREILSTTMVKSKSSQRFVKDEEMNELLINNKKTGKESSPVRTKVTALERAFLDLEKGVAELCPPSLIAREPEQGKRNRLPRELKLKLAKVARLAAKQGRITDEIMERLMGILGHVIRERTLKRHLKAMIENGISAMQEKEGRLQCMKKEVTELIKSKVHNLQEAHPPNDFQSMGPHLEKVTGDGRYQWDNATEDKICDLYEQYIEGMDENKGPLIRKLYAELAELWPDGWMDNSGIKLAVHRAKERKRKLNKALNSSEAKARRKPSMKPKVEDSSSDGLTLLQLFTPGGSSSASAEKMNHLGYEAQLLLQEKKKISSRHETSDGKSKSADEALIVKKKMKREVEKGINTSGDFSAIPLGMSGSMLHTSSFSSPVSLTLPFDPALHSRSANGTYVSPH